MTGSELKSQRAAAGIAGRLLAVRAKVDHSRLCHIERGYVQPSAVELERIETALEELIHAKQKLAALAVQLGWPVSAL